MNKKIQKLNDKKEQLQQKIVGIEEQEPKQKILQAIGKQKYFYLKEYPHIIFDRDTSYLWPEKEFDINKIKNVELTAENFADEDEVTTLLSELQEVDYLKLKGWEIPTPYDFQSIIDKNNSDSRNSLPSLMYQNEDTLFVFGHDKTKQNTLIIVNNLLFRLYWWKGLLDPHNCGNPRGIISGIMINIIDNKEGEYEVRKMSGKLRSEQFSL